MCNFEQLRAISEGAGVPNYYSPDLTSDDIAMIESIENSAEYMDESAVYVNEGDMLVFHESFCDTLIDEFESIIEAAQYDMDDDTYDDFVDILGESFVNLIFESAYAMSLDMDALDEAGVFKKDKPLRGFLDMPEKPKPSAAAKIRSVANRAKDKATGAAKYAKYKAANAANKARGAAKSAAGKAGKKIDQIRNRKKYTAMGKEFMAQQHAKENKAKQTQENLKAARKRTMDTYRTLMLKQRERYSDKAAADSAKAKDEYKSKSSGRDDKADRKAYNEYRRKDDDIYSAAGKRSDKNYKRAAQASELFRDNYPDDKSMQEAVTNPVIFSDFLSETFDQ